MPESDPRLPYNDLPPLPPSLERIETRDILKQCIAARVALAELKQAAELITNSAVLVNALPLLEARAKFVDFMGSDIEWHDVGILANLRERHPVDEEKVEE